MQMNHKFSRINGEFAKFVEILLGGKVWEGWGSHPPPPRKLPKTTTWTVGIFPEEYNPISTVVTEIIKDGQTDRQTYGQTDGQTSSNFVL